MLGRLKRASPDLLIDIEEWMLVKSDILRFSREDIDNMPMSKVSHFIGFEMGAKEKAKMEQKQRERQQGMKQFLEDIDGK